MNLTTMRDNVERDLDDAGNAVWSTDEIDRAITRALVEYSKVNSLRAVTTINVTSERREFDLSGVSGLLRVAMVWWPYTAAEPEYPPNWVKFRIWANTLYLQTEDEPQSGDVIRLYYLKKQTIDGLEGAAATTVPVDDEELIILGATAYAALEKARTAIGKVGVSEETPEHWRNWGNERFLEFKAGLDFVRDREAMGEDARVGPWELEES